MSSRRRVTTRILLLVVIVTLTSFTSSAYAAVESDVNRCGLIIDIYRDLHRNYSTHCDKISDTHFVCGGFEGVNELPLNNRPCIRLKQHHPLNSVLTINGATGFRMYSFPENKTFSVTCNDGMSIPSGFDFTNSASVSISNIKFVNCGHSKPSSVKLPNTKHVVTISTAFYFANVNHVSIAGVSMSNCHGYAVSMYNVYGAVTFDKVDMRDSQTIGFSSEGHPMKGYSSGGAIYIEYNQQKIEQTRILLTNSVFFNNTADRVSPAPRAEGVAEEHIGFGRGGAFSIFFLDNMKNVEVQMTNVLFDYNHAAWGGAVYARFRGYSFNNTIRLTDTNFTRNGARLSGGGVFVTDTQKEGKLNTLHLSGCHFSHNTAEVAGALALKYISKESITMSQYSSIKRTNFTFNTARIGFALNLEMAPVIFANARLNNNTGIEASGQGAIYTFGSVLHFNELTRMFGNQQTAIVSDCSTLHMRDHVTFEENVGENGGAVSMYGSSRIVLYNTTELAFTRNRAWRRGGAVFVQYSGPSIDHLIVHTLSFKQCFVQFQGTSLRDAVNGSFRGKVLFDHNVATINGDGVFITSLASCTVGASAKDTLTGWRGFTFLPRDREHVITRAIRITVNPEEWNQSPGKLFTPNVTLHDQRGNNVSEQINVHVWKNSPVCAVTIETNERFVVTDHDTISLTLLGNNQPESKCTYNVTISLAWNNFTSKTLLDRHLKPCHFGFSFDKITQQCRCNMQKNRAKGIAYCYKNEIFFFKNRWASTRQLAYSKDKETTVKCPTDYCNQKCETTLCRYDRDNHKVCTKEPICRFDEDNPQQCAEHRDQNSTMCGSCAAGYSVALGSEDCVRCDGNSKYNWIWMVLCIFVVFAIIDAVIIWLGIDIYSNYLNGFLYYCQVVVLLPPSSFTMWPPMRFVAGLLNMESSGGSMPKICFIKGFNDLHKQLFNYLFPAIMLFILFVMGRLARRQTFARLFARTNCIGAFTIISVIAYNDVTRVTFTLLNIADIDPSSRKRWVWIHGNTEYFSTEHLPYAITALVIGLIFVIGFPLVLVFSSKLVAVRLCYNPLTQLIPLFTHFTYCFRKDYFYFASFYFFARLVMLGINTFSPSGPLTSTLNTVTCYLVCIFFAYHKPYIHKSMNWFDLFVLVNLTAVSVLALMMRSSKSQKQEVFSNIMNPLILLPFLIVASRMVWVYGKVFCKWAAPKLPTRERIPKKTNYPQRTILPSSDDEQDANGGNDGSDDVVGSHGDSNDSSSGAEDEEDSYNPYQNMQS